MFKRDVCCDQTLENNAVTRPSAVIREGVRVSHIVTHNAAHIAAHASACRVHDADADELVCTGCDEDFGVWLWHTTLVRSA